MQYKGIVKTRTPKYRGIMLIGCIVLFILEFMYKQYFYILFTVLLLAAVFHKKEHVVSEKGVDIVNDILGYRTHNLWTWDEIAMVQPDYMKAKPNVMVTFEKNTSMLRPFVFTPDDAAAVLALSKKMNSSTYVDDYTREEQEELEKEKKKARQQNRARKKKK